MQGLRPKKYSIKFPHLSSSWSGEFVSRDFKMMSNVFIEHIFIKLVTINVDQCFSNLTTLRCVEF